MPDQSQGQVEAKEPDFDAAFAWIDGAEMAGYPNEHAALIEYCFAPPESYEDAWLEKIWDVYLYVLAQPCTCTQEIVDDALACPRCLVLNREFDKEAGRGR